MFQKQKGKYDPQGIAQGDKNQQFSNIKKLKL